MEKIKAIFFDYDDTLQDRTAAYRIFCMRFLEKYFPEIFFHSPPKMRPAA